MEKLQKLNISIMWNYKFHSYHEKDENEIESVGKLEKIYYELGY